MMLMLAGYCIFGWSEMEWSTEEKVSQNKEHGLCLCVNDDD